ncbi:hypothetical protein D3C71_1116750 [compost metagenome]
MPHQVHLGRAGDGQDGVHLCEQLLTPDLGAVGGRHLGHVDLGAALAQGVRDAVEVVDTQGRIKPEKPVHKHDGVAGLGGARLGLRAGADEQQCGGRGQNKSPQKAAEESGHAVVSIGMFFVFAKKERPFVFARFILLFFVWSHYRDIPEPAIQKARKVKTS